MPLDLQAWLFARGYEDHKCGEGYYLQLPSWSLGGQRQPTPYLPTLWEITLAVHRWRSHIELERSFFIRMKCVLAKRNAGLTSGGYK
ncbi:SIM2, partial [Cordylochernes scorpioides]